MGQTGCTPVLKHVRGLFSDCHEPETHIMDVREALDQEGIAISRRERALFPV
jgi:hypothetical protein